MTEMEQKNAKEALKILREQRKNKIDNARGMIKKQTKIIKAITGALKEGAKTIPELSTAIGSSSAETLLYVATLKKYGMIGEGAKEGDYFKYELSAP